jgi:RNA polymerase sigma-70 factor (ECF subfamily)
MTPRLERRLRPGDFDRLYERHVGDVYRYAVAVLASQADAADVTETTFRNAYRALESGERPARARNWLIAIAHGVCRQRVHRLAHPADRLEEEADQHQVTDEIRRALVQLSFNQRAALVMRELHGRSNAEIAGVLELPLGAVQTLLFRARRALREELEASRSCHRAELAVSQDLDGRLSRPARRVLRAHLGECPDCATFASRQRSHRVAFGSLGSVALPASLAAGKSSRK